MRTAAKEALLESGKLSISAPAQPSCGDRLRYRAAASVKRAANDVGGLLVGSLIFVVSRVWSDALKGFILRFSSPWFYDDIDLPAVQHPATSHQWLLLVLCLVPVGGLFKHLAEDYIERAQRAGRKPVRGVELVPTVMNYIVGWNAAYGALAFLVEQREAGCRTTGCVGLNVTHTLVWTGAAAVFIAFVKPYALEIEWGSGALIDWMEDYCEDFLALVIRALSIVVVWGCLPASPTQDSGRD